MLPPPPFKLNFCYPPPPEKEACVIPEKEACVTPRKVEPPWERNLCDPQRNLCVPLRKKPIWPPEKETYVTPEKETYVTPGKRNLCDTTTPSYYIMQKLKVGVWDWENFWLVAGKKPVWPFLVTWSWKSWRLKFGLWKCFLKNFMLDFEHMGATQRATQCQGHSRFFQSSKFSVIWTSWAGTQQATLQTNLTSKSTSRSEASFETNKKSVDKWTHRACLSMCLFFISIFGPQNRSAK